MPVHVAKTCEHRQFGRQPVAKIQLANVHHRAIIGAIVDAGAPRVDADRIGREDRAIHFIKAGVADFEGIAIAQAAAEDEARAGGPVDRAAELPRRALHEDGIGLVVIEDAVAVHGHGLIEGFRLMRFRPPAKLQRLDEPRQPGALFFLGQRQLRHQGGKEQRHHGPGLRTHGQTPFLGRSIIPIPLYRPVTSPFSDHSAFPADRTVKMGQEYQLGCQPEAQARRSGVPRLRFGLISQLRHHGAFLLFANSRIAMLIVRTPVRSVGSGTGA